ncbi:hypothetical protein JQC91_07715 [Jannaschia sp. Os4]|uniref:hypothetical protein n=1 Tax=Jannaschia sp. Os4 TaxID=2807617 RepID=UPI00193933E6|nr:hypothetical protein [Jannaschia sp. Os4]MBM2576190.1 hypothetical protein [Jannaschia sp. Os4]
MIPTPPPLPVRLRAAWRALAGRRPHLVIHAGMHKTGSTAIQAAFARGPVGDVTHVPWRERNHSRPFRLAFDPGDRRTAFLRGGADPDTSAAAARADLDAGLAQVRTARALISAEDMGAAPEAALRAFAEAVRPRVASWEVIAYLRPPAEAVASKTQQQIRMGRRVVDAFMVQDYRAGLEALERVFGAEAVTLLPYRRADLSGGDVVADFAHRLGVPPPDAPNEAVNAALPVEAIAVLHVHALHAGPPVAGPDAAGGHARLGEALAALGDAPLRVTRATTERVLRATPARRADLDWVAARMGAGFVAVPEADPPGAIAALGELDGIARGAEGRLHDLCVGWATDADRRRALDAVARAGDARARIAGRVGLLGGWIAADPGRPGPAT